MSSVTGEEERNDPADESVLVVHGIANRSAEAFQRDVDRLAGVLAPRRVVPVFWGDLGPSHDLTCLPTPTAEDLLVGPVVPTSPDLVVDEAARRVAEVSGEPVPSGTLAVLRQALRSRGAGRRPEEDPVTEVLAQSVLLAGPVDSADVGVDGGDGGDARSGALARRLRAVVQAVDDGVEGLSQGLLTSLVRDRAGGLGALAARTVGDVLTYERHGSAIRGRLDEAYQEACRTSRVHLLGHSLGALIAIEWLLGADAANPQPTDPADRHVATVVTFGAQVSLFCELHGLLTVDGHTPRTAPVEISARIRRWYNVWHALDPLAFVMSPVLLLRDEDGADLIQDLRLDPDGLGLSLTFHSSYWSDARFLAWLADAL